MNGRLRPQGEGTRDEGVVAGLLPVETCFQQDKRVEPATPTVDGVGPLSGTTGTVTGYEIQMGPTTVPGAVDRPSPGS